MAAVEFLKDTQWYGPRRGPRTPENGPPIAGDQLDVDGDQVTLRDAFRWVARGIARWVGEPPAAVANEPATETSTGRRR